MTRTLGCAVASWTTLLSLSAMAQSPARVALERPTAVDADVGFDADAVATRLRASLSTVHQCYLDLLADAPTLEGRVTIQFDVHSAGRGAATVVDEPTSAALGRCAQAFASRAASTLGSYLHSGVVRVTLAFSLAPPEPIATFTRASFTRVARCWDAHAHPRTHGPSCPSMANCVDLPSDPDLAACLDREHASLPGLGTLATSGLPAEIEVAPEASRTIARCLRARAGRSPTELDMIACYALAGAITIPVGATWGSPAPHITLRPEPTGAAATAFGNELASAAEAAVVACRGADAIEADYVVVVADGQTSVVRVPSAPTDVASDRVEAALRGLPIVHLAVRRWVLLHVSLDGS